MTAGRRIAHADGFARQVVVGLILLLWLALASPALAQSAPAFPPLTGRVVDQGDLLSGPKEDELETKLAALERDTGVQLVVATVTSLQGREIEDYGYQLGRAWGIGQAGDDNGVLLIVAPNERKVRIEVGYGLEGVLTDALSALIIQNRILPSFRTGGYEAGVTNGVAAIDEQLRLDPAEAEARAAAAAGPKSRIPIGPLILVGGVFLMLFISLLGAVGARGRRRPRGNGLAPILIWAAAEAMRNSHRGGGGFGGGGFGGGFSGGGGSFGGGGASGGW